jgi:hypothetical protein
MKEKFHPLRTQKLSNLNIAGLCSETITACNVARSVLGTLGNSSLNKLESDYTAFSAKLIVEKASPITAQIREFDENRDSDFAEIVRTADTASKSSIAANAAAGKLLMAFLRPYHGITKKPIMTQTESFRFLKEHYIANTALTSAATELQLTEVFASLFQENEQVFILWNERANEDAAKAGPSPSSLRGELAKSYDAFCDIVIRTIEFQPSQKLSNLFEVMNEIRIKYSHLLPSKLTGSNTTVEAIPAQPFTGSRITPIPRVFFSAEGEQEVELQFSVDFYVTYRDNIKVGEARVFIHGKGKYCGSHTSTFYIERN